MTENDTPTTTRRTALKVLGGAAATAATASTAAAQSTPTAPPTETASDDGEQVVAQIGPIVTLRDWRYQSGVFTLTLDAEYPSAVKITDSGAVMRAWSEGSGGGVTEIPTRGVEITGRTTVEFDAVEFNGAAALTVASTRGTVLIRSDAIETGKPAVDFGTAGLLAGASAVGSGWYSFRRGREKLEESDEPEADRIA
ncbi:hypothetical protein [Halobaculum sp. D14]|uniref:hypothetical protein n=1 Tax=Halobaculum sp. D14 TaxID=3421642 RepID=UPI003EBF2437